MPSNVGVNVWVAGAFAGASINLLIYPLDTVKTRLQSSSLQQTYRSAAGISSRLLWRNVYQGVGTVMLVAIPSSGVFFTTYEGLKYCLGSSSSTAAQGLLPQPVVHAFSSSVAQLINCAVVAPAEVIKQNAQMLAVAPSSASGAGKKVSLSPTMIVLRQLQQHPTRLWRGYTALAARDLPFAALQFPAYEYLKEILMARRLAERQSGGVVIGVFEQAWMSAISAGLAGSAAAWVTTPFDVVKTRMMVGVGAKDSSKAELGRRKSGFQVGAEVLRKEGVRGLFRGGLIRATLTILGNGLYMGCYEGAKLFLSQKNYQNAALA